MKNIKKSVVTIVKKIWANKFLIILVLLLNYLSYKEAFGYFFWRDDWAFLWSSKYNPSDFYHTTVGAYWFVRTGLFNMLFAQLHSILDNSFQWQLIGFSLKVINSFIFYFFVKQIVKRKDLAYAGAIIFSSYAGGIEAYTWHLPTGLVITFLLLAVLNYLKYTEKFVIKHFFLFLIFISLAFLSFVGRVMGVFPILFLWNILICFKVKNSEKVKKLLLINVFLVLCVFVIGRFMPSYTVNPFVYLVESLKHIEIYFESIGNLIKVPFIENQELGGLAAPNLLSFSLGVIGLLSIIPLFIKFVVTKKDRYIYLLMSIIWIYGFYIFNWLYGGGDVTTLVGSVHRYLSISGVGVIMLTILIIDFTPRSFRTVIVAILIVVNIVHANKINTSEGSVRYKQIVEPIYQEILRKTNKSQDVDVLIVDTPNKLKSFVVLGWLPYTYAYYTGLRETTKFPAVFPDWDSAIQWACSPIDKKKEIEVRLGVVNYRNIYKVDLNKLFAFRLEVNGKITDQTDNFRDRVKSCI